MQKYSGVTLLEILVGLVVAGILASLAIPSFRVMLVRRQVSSAFEALVTDFRFARSEALKRGHSVTICRSSDGLACEPVAGGWEVGWVVFDDRNGDTAVNTGEQILRRQPPPPGVTVAVVTGSTVSGGARYEFRANGLATGNAGSITVTGDPLVANNPSINDARRLLCVSLQGRLSLQPPGITSC